MDIARLRRDVSASVAEPKVSGLLDIPGDASFEALVQAASLGCDAPIAFLRLIDTDGQGIRVLVGLPGHQDTPAAMALCTQAVLSDQLMEVEDTHRDLRCHDTAGASGAAQVRFYAGMPLQLSDGRTVGTLCVMDHQPRRLTDHQRHLLRLLATAAAQAIEQHLRAQTLAATANWFRGLVDDQMELVSIATPDGVLTYVNHAYARALGFTADAMAGQDLLSFVPVDQQEAIRVHFATVCSSTDVAHIDNQMRGANGELRWYEWTNRAVRDAQGLVTAVHSVGRDSTERRLMDKRLADKRKRIANILDGTHAGTWEWHVTTGELLLNDHCAAIVGYTLEDLAPTTAESWLGLLHPDDRYTATALLQRHFVGDLEVYECDVRMRHRAGHWVWVQTRGRVLTHLPSGAPEWMFGTHIDVSERRRMSALLAEKHELLRVTLQSIGDAVITTDAKGIVTWLNPVAQRMTGWQADEAQGHPLTEVFHIVNEHTRVVTDNPVATCLEQCRIVGLANHTLLMSRDGQEFGIEDSAAPIRNEAGEVLGVVLVFHDVSEQRRLSGEMTYRATHDLLTTLVNRVEFEARLLRVLRKAQEEHSQHAMLYIDLDQFKLINDACGHAVGDQLLQQVGKLLTEAVRSRDTVARLGGDEFGILLAHCSIEQAREVAQDICDRMADFRFVHEDRRFRVGSSIGLVPIDQRWVNTAAIQQAADTSCYAAKEAGRNRVHLWFDSDVAMQARHHEMQWTSRIERALDDNSFVLFAQRIQDLKNQPKGIRAEVLLRMRDDDGGLILPGAFLPAAERFRLVTRVDRWVLGHVVNWLGGLPSLHLIDSLSVNLSGHSVSDREFHQWAYDMLASAGSGICAKLCLEITETAAVTSLTDAASFIHDVRRAGVKVALDDFGAGASSFGYLKSLRVDALKIDGQFIRHLVKDALDEAAVRCFVEVAQLIGVRTVAEFVDNAEVLMRLRELGVDYAQGYLIHRPEPIHQLVEAEMVRMSAGSVATDPRWTLRDA